MNYLSEPRGAAVPFGAAPLYEPRGAAVPFGAAPLYEPRGAAVPFGQISGEAKLGPVTVRAGDAAAAPEEKIMGLSKPVFFGLAAVLVAGGLYFAMKA